MNPNITGFDNEEYNALIEQLYEETDIAARAAPLHDAEELLLSKMPVIPIIFNQDAYVISKDLSGYSSSYYQNRLFAKLKLKNYELYIETTAEDTTTETVK
jgi:ABC-type oligopeptide transport system substrate-binding subunit